MKKKPSFQKKSELLKMYNLSDKERNLLSKLDTQSFFSLNSDKRNLAKTLTKGYASDINKAIIECYSFAINPITLGNIQSGIGHYIFFIDALRSDYYQKLKNYLSENKLKINSYNISGAADFVLEFYGNFHCFEQFMTEVLHILKNVPYVDKGPEELINGYQVEDYLIFWSQILNGGYARPQDKDIDLAKLELFNRNYMGPELSDKFSYSEIKSFLRTLEEKKIILSYFTIKDFISYGTLRQYILLQASKPFIDICLDNPNLLKNILHLFKVKKRQVVNPFFEGIDYILVTKFTSMYDYHIWKEELYKVAENSNQHVNVFTFDIESRISEQPVKIGNYPEYENLRINYNCVPEDYKIILGSPIHFITNEIETDFNVCINLDTINHHGLICGTKGCGKTITSITLCKKLWEKRKGIHILDATGGIEGKINEMKESKNSFQIMDVDKTINNARINLESTTDKIYCYFASIKKLQILFEVLFEQIVQKADVKEKKPGYRHFENLILFEEAHTIFTDQKLITKLFQLLQIANRKGLSIWLSTQRLSQISFEEQGHALYEDLKNRIFHKLEDGEDPELVEKLLFQPKDTSKTLYKIKTEVQHLHVGEVFTSFVAASERKFFNLAPIKAKIIKLE